MIRAGISLLVASVHNRFNWALLLLLLLLLLVGGLVVSQFAPKGVGGGFDSSPTGLLVEQVVVQLRGMHLMIGTTLMSEYGQKVVVKN